MADASNRSALWIWSIFAFIFTALGMVVAIATPHPATANGPAMFLLGCTFGFLFGAVSILSIWTALETTRYRVYVSVFANIAIGSMFNIFVNRTGGPWSVVFIAWATLALLNVAIQGPLWFLRLRSGYQFKSHTENKVASEQKQPQFSIGQMLLLTTMVAVLIAVLKVLIPRLQLASNGGGTSDVLSWVLLFSFWGASAAITALGALWVMSVRKAIPLVAVTLLWCGLAIASAFQTQSLGPGNLAGLVAFSVTCNVVAALMVCVPLLVLNAWGRRLEVNAG